MSELMKAIKITSENKTKLEQQFHLDEGFLEFCSGLYVVAGFGDETLYEGIFTKSGYEARFTETGKKLNNGYVEVVAK